ncbi:MAG: lytic murein transglycosylase, partial [Pseudomonadales bacterium]|nr:lytic murein transglycosylase [Pseudomonadales bacterium]
MLTFTRNIRLRVYSVALSSLVLSPLNLYASENPPEFDQCLVNLKQNAISAGVNTETIEKSFQNIAYSEKVIELDRKQPEFTSSFSRYLNLRVNDRRVKTGREMLAQHRSLLQEVTRKSGVPAQYIVAFWGLETNYGGYLGNMSTLDSLATLACDRRRSTFFTGEFIAALRLIEKGDASAESMRGSWAGAVGNFQFMPSNYLTHAHDHDGDGKRDLWNSLEDAAMSAGLFLKSMGWETGTRWGREVKLPASFDYAAAGLDQPRELEAWRKMGLRTADGKSLPKAQLKASLLVPAGHKGPKFLVYSNFRVIMGWNR